MPDNTVSVSLTRADILLLTTSLVKLRENIQSSTNLAMGVKALAYYEIDAMEILLDTAAVRLTDEG